MTYVILKLLHKMENNGYKNFGSAIARLNITTETTRKKKTNHNAGNALKQFTDKRHIFYV